MEFIGLTLSELNGKLAVVIDYENKKVYLAVADENLILTGKEAAFILESLDNLIKHLIKNFQVMKEPDSSVN